MKYASLLFRGDLGHLIAERSPLVKTGPGRRLVTLFFSKDSVGEAIISETSRLYHVNLNIVLANVDILQGSPMGYTVVVAEGDEENIEAALEHFRASGVRTEVMTNE